jgi:hypothetical protein
MKLQAKNFQGNLSVPYKVLQSTYGTENAACVSLHLKLPGQEFYYEADCCLSNTAETYKQNLMRALVIAEQTWGLELISLDLSGIDAQIKTQ